MTKDKLENLARNRQLKPELSTKAEIDALMPTSPRRLTLRLR